MENISAPRASSKDFSKENGDMGEMKEEDGSLGIGMIGTTKW